MPNYDDMKTGRNTKSTKDKKNRELNGGFSQKHVRLQEELIGRRKLLGACQKVVKN